MLIIPVGGYFILYKKVHFGHSSLDKFTKPSGSKPFMS